MSRPKARLAVVAAIALATALAACGPGPVVPKGIQIVKTVFVGAADEAAGLGRIWGRALTAAETAEGLSTWKAASKMPGITAIAPLVTRTIADEVRASLQAATEGAVVLIGHRDESQFLRLADDSQVALAGIGQETAGARVIVISCQTAVICGPGAAGLGTDISPGVALRTRQLLPNYLAGLPDNPTDQLLEDTLQTAANQALVDSKLELTPIKAVRLVGLGGGAVAIEFFDSRAP